MMPGAGGATAVLGHVVAATARKVAVAEPVTESDREDIAASLRGDESAYARLIARYQATITNQMWKYSRDPLVVEELVQEVFVESYLGLAQFRGQAPFVHWLRRIASRVGYRYWKKRAKRKEVEEILRRESPDGGVPPDDASPREAAEWLHRLLGRLAPEDRMVLTLHYFEGLDMNSIAERMGWTRTLAKVRAFRARKRLRVLLEEAGYERS
jgi:RNA polymerase sigma-70 factor (ECF subfamily)